MPFVGHVQNVKMLNKHKIYDLIKLFIFLNNFFHIYFFFNTGFLMGIDAHLVCICLFYFIYLLVYLFLFQKAPNSNET